MIAALWAASARRGRIARTLLIRHQDQRWQAAGRIEGERRPCLVSRAPPPTASCDLRTATISANPAENLKAVLDRIEAARKAAIAPAGETRLIAVTKGMGPSASSPFSKRASRVLAKTACRKPNEMAGFARALSPN